MAITYSIAPNPHWVIIDNFSNLPPGAVVYTYDSLNPSQFKPVYTDATGSTPYTQPVMGFGNGTIPPMFFKFDSSNPNDLYYIQVWSGIKGVNGSVMLWDFNGLTGIGGGGGGGSVVSSLDIENFVINGEFYRNTGNIASGAVPLSVTLAPSNNAGFVNDSSNVNGPTGPDIVFAKNNTNATDAITFTNFTPGSSNLLPNPTPQLFVDYNCTVLGSGETYKYFQFPICKGLQNLSGVTVSFNIWSNYISGDQGIFLRLRQFFGSGTNGPSADAFQTIGTLNTSNPGTWTSSPFTSVVVNSIGGNVIGNCGNDALFLQLAIPLALTTHFQFILPSMYLGATPSTLNFHTLDFVDAIVNSPRTGDVRITLNSFLPGWVQMNDGTIGSSSSNATGRANQDTFALFDLIWRTFQANQTLAPMFTSGAVPTSYGASSVADFGANNQISLTKAAGRVLAGVSGSHLIGTTVGAETYTLQANDLPAHNHGALGTGQFVNTGSGGNNYGSGGFTTSSNSTTGNNSTPNNPVSLFQPTTFYNVFIKL